jgi:predicted amidohydrolase
LLIARAIENQCYVLGVNRVGTDAKGHSYAGGSLVVAPDGEVIAHGTTDEMLVQATLNWDRLATLREKFPVALDADAFELK